MYPSIYLSIYLQVWKRSYSFWTWQHQKRSNSAGLLHFWTWQRQKRSYSARLPRFFKLTTSKTKQFCETSFKNGKLSAELTASCKCVLRLFHSICLNYCACHEKWDQVTRNTAPFTRNHLSKPDDVMHQMQSLSGNQRPDLLTSLMNMSPPATRNASLQILLKCPSLPTLSTLL